MATVSKQFFRGSASTSEVTLYSVPTSTNAVVTNVIVSNASSSDQNFSLKLNGVELTAGTEIPANSIVTFDMKQVLSPLEIIQGRASATSVKFHISGVEIS
jgi:hypothetical protein